ncbi:MAG: zf-HC2 domain-containing protein [Gemmatimonadaceae bacterium]
MRDLLPELVNGRLDAMTQLAVEAHVAECEECAEEVELLRALRPALMRGPVVDATSIAAAVRAQVPATARRGVARPAPMWTMRIAAALLLAVGAIGFAYALRGKRAAPEVAVTHAPVVVRRDSVPSPAPAPEQRVAVAPSPAMSPPLTPRPAATVVTSVASVGVLDNLSDLSDDDVRSLTASLDGLSAVPTADPAPDIDPLGATLDDQSAGGSR